MRPTNRKSRGEYPENWREIASGVKQESGWRCTRCGADHDPEAGYTLTVHHLDLNPENCEWWNIPALCQRCHLHVQSTIIMGQLFMFEIPEWFKPYLAGYYAHLRGLPNEREYVMGNVETIIQAQHAASLQGKTEAA